MPLHSTEIVLYGVPADAQPNTDLVVEAVTLSRLLGGVVQETVEVSEAIRADGTSVAMNSELAFDMLAIRIDSENVSGHFESIPSLAALAEVRVEAKVVEGANPTSSFVRGDTDCDGVMNIVDPIALLNFLFGGGPLCCQAAGDTNADGVLNITDPIRNLNFLFAGGMPPPGPFPNCGPVIETVFTCGVDSCR